MTYYTVKRGDTLTKIEGLQLNRIKYDKQLEIDDENTEYVNSEQFW